MTNEYKKIIESIKSNLELVEKNMDYFLADQQEKLVEDVTRNLKNFEAALLTEVKDTDSIVRDMEKFYQS